MKRKTFDYETDDEGKPCDYNFYVSLTNKVDKSGRIILKKLKMFNDVCETPIKNKINENITIDSGSTVCESPFDEKKLNEINNFLAKKNLFI